MPWNDNAGNGGGPWGERGGKEPPKSPWGPPPGGGGGPRRPQGPNGQGPDLDDLMRQMQERFKGAVGSGGGGGSGQGEGLNRNTIMGIAGLVLAGWLATGVFQVDAGEQGVVTQFGRFARIADPGLHFHLPSPIEAVEIVQTSRERTLEIGGVQQGADGAAAEGLMLTGDENIVDIGFQVNWTVSDARAFLFNVADPESAVRSVAESAMREAVGSSQLQAVLTTGRSQIETQTRELLQKTLDSYGAGVRVTRVNLRRADPPARVQEAFRAVAGAGQEAERLVNQATAYRNQVVPVAQGEAARFNQLYAEYQRAPDVMRQRLYIEAMERVYSRSNKVILDTGSANGGSQPMIVLPPELLRGAVAPPATAQDRNAQSAQPEIRP
jgi:membrane protease subunit HflK